jgi:dsRNA-specific ribonuclease
MRYLLTSNISLLNEAMTSPSTQLTTNYERLEIYGDSLITLMVIVELYLTREHSFTENDLDNLRKQRTSNEALMLINCRSELYRYMMTEPLC